jgi:hypothetical protein
MKQGKVMKTRKGGSRVVDTDKKKSKKKAKQKDENTTDEKVKENGTD